MKPIHSIPKETNKFADYFKMDAASIQKLTEYNEVSQRQVYRFTDIATATNQTFQDFNFNYGPTNIVYPPTINTVYPTVREQERTVQGTWNRDAWTDWYANRPLRLTPLPTTDGDV